MRKIKRRVTWEEIDKLVINLAHQIKPLLSEIKNICGVPRGGLIPAVMLSYRTGLPLVSIHDIGPKTLVVDDIVDSGKTLARLVKNYGAVKTAALYVSPKTKQTPMFTTSVHKDEEWLLFPYEQVESSKRDHTI